MNLTTQSPEAFAEYLSGPGGEVLLTLIRGLTRLTLDVQRVGEFLESLQALIDAPFAKLHTLSMPKLQWTNRADILKLDELVPAVFPKLGALEFVVCVASDRTEEENWRRNVGCGGRSDSENGPARAKARRVVDEVASYLPTCAANGWLRPIDDFYVVDESDMSHWM